MVECKEILDLLSELVDSELEDSLENEFFEHIHKCRHCSPYYNTFKKDQNNQN